MSKLKDFVVETLLTIAIIVGVPVLVLLGVFLAGVLVLTVGVAFLAPFYLLYLLLGGTHVF